MAKGLDLRNIKKDFFPFTFKDGKKIFVTMPTKKIFDELSNIDENSDESTDQIYSALASALSRNKSKTKITKEYLEQNVDIEEVIIIFKGYVDFVSENANQKN